MRARVRILRIHVKARPASVITALGRERLRVSSARWLSGLAESGLPAERELTSKDKVDKDQGGHPSPSLFACVYMCTDNPPTGTPTYACEYVYRHDTHIHMQKREKDKSQAVHTTQTIWLLLHQLPLGWIREARSTCSTICPCHWLCI